MTIRLNPEVSREVHAFPRIPLDFLLNIAHSDDELLEDWIGRVIDEIWKRQAPKDPLSGAPKAMPTSPLAPDAGRWGWAIGTL